VNEDELVAVPPGVVTEIGPGGEPLGTVARIAPFEIRMKVASVPANRMLLAPAKLVPAIWMVVPASPQVGVNDVIAGVTVNDVLLVAVPFAVTTEIGPSDAKNGTVAWISASESSVKSAGMPPNFTALAPVKFIPTMSTLDPTGPLPGDNDVITGEGTTAPSTVRSSMFDGAPQAAAASHSKVTPTLNNADRVPSGATSTPSVRCHVSSLDVAPIQSCH
jgi:hypothetical protein